jgi:hypothetical protein
MASLSATTTRNTKMAKASDSFNYLMESNVDGIPCLIGIGYYNKVKGNPYTWDSDMDYYGYEEMEWEVLDRKGYSAKWLEKKLTDNITNRIETEISEYMKEIREESLYDC